MQGQFSSANAAPQSPALRAWEQWAKVGRTRCSDQHNNYNYQTPHRGLPQPHLNCGIVGTLMRGGGGAATLAALPTPLGSTDILLKALLSAPAFGRPLPRFPVAAEPPPGAPPPRANEAAGVAKTRNNAIAIFTEIFDTGKLRSFRSPPNVKLMLGR